MFTAFQKTAFQNNAFQISIIPISVGGDDADWTKEDRKRHKALQKKIKAAEEKRLEALRADKASRKGKIRDLVDPPKKTKGSSGDLVVQTPKEKIANLDAYIANLEKQKADLLNAILIKAAQARLEMELSFIESQRQAEQDDEEALLALIL